MLISFAIILGKNISTFKSGGVAADRIRNLVGYFDIGNADVNGRGTLLFKVENGVVYSAGNFSGERYWRLISFDPSRVVPTGNENSVRTISDCFWRRVA
jgi:hypothetical protein